MDWGEIVQTSIIGAVIGTVVGVGYARSIIKTRRAFVLADLQRRGLVAKRIDADWFHLGTSARFKVELERSITAARVDRHGAVTWEREPG